MKLLVVIGAELVMGCFVVGTMMVKSNEGHNILILYNILRVIGGELVVFSTLFFKPHLGQNSRWRRRGCNWGKATITEANCASQCEQILDGKCEENM